MSESDTAYPKEVSMTGMIVKYFGDPKFRKEYEVQVVAPVGVPCVLCDEPVAEGDTGTINLSGQVTHYECHLRVVIGSVGHQMKRCSCYGGTEEDPPGLSQRQAAQAAVEYWYQHDGRKSLG